MLVHGRVAAVVGSVIVHAGVLAWLGARGVAPAPPPFAARPHVGAPPPPAIVQAAPVDVVLLDDAALARIDATSAHDARIDQTPRAMPRAAASRVVASRGGHADDRASSAQGDGAADRPAPGRSPLMTLRMPGRDAPRGVSGDFLADFLARSKPLPPPPDIPGERVGNELADARAKLRRASRYGAAELAALRAEVVRLNDERAAEELKPAGGGTYATEKETFRAKVAADGTVALEDRPENLDAQDKLMRRHGVDPYARSKLAYLDRTRDQRVAIGDRHRRAQLARAPQLVQQHVEWLWASTRDLAARKAGLFELWDDCAESGADELVAAGAAVRAFVVGVIRARLRGADAYTPAELARLNARRRSRAVFAPYD